MKLGFYNSCFMDWDLETTAAFAAQNGFAALELRGVPDYRFIDWSRVAAGETKPVLAPLERHGLTACGLMWGALNFVHPDEGRRVQAAESLRMLIRAAKQCGIPLVSTFTGRDPLKTPEENLPAVVEAFKPLAEEAEAAGVRIAFENCPMSHFWPPHFNIAVTPHLWGEIFDRVQSRFLGLNVDPSHLIWQGVDYIDAVRMFRDRIFLAQAKDTELMPNIQRTHGMYHPDWWRHRIPGQGDVNWNKFISVLREVGYDGVLSIEHEDPIWSGTTEKVVRGLQLSAAHLRQYL